MNVLVFTIKWVEGFELLSLEVGVDLVFFIHNINNTNYWLTI